MRFLVRRLPQRWHETVPRLFGATLNVGAMSVLGKAAQGRRPLTAGLLHDWVNVAALTAIFVLSAAALEFGEESSLHTIVIAVTAAYLVSDALWIALQPDMVKTPVSVILHHLVTLIVIVEPMFYESHRVNASRALLVEINTVLLTLRRLLGRPPWCELGFYLTWALIRLIWFPALGTALLASTFGWVSPLAALPPPLTALVVEVRPPAIRSYASLSFAAVVMLQFYWTCAMGRGMCKSGANRESRKERSLESEPSAPANLRYLALSLLSTGLIAGSLLYWMSPRANRTQALFQRMLRGKVLMAAAFAAARGLTRAISRCASKRVPERALFSRLSAPAPPALAALPGVRAFSRTSWESGDDVDLDSVAYGFMASQALFSALELGIFDKVAAAGEKGCAAKDVQQACGVEGPRLTTLLTALTAVKCLRRSDEGLYTLSPNTAQYMVSSSRHYYGDYLQYQIGRQFYHRMGALPEVMTTGKAPSYASWFSDPEVAKTYTQAQHNGSVATAKYLVRKKLDLGGISSMLDVGGGSGAFSYVFTEATPGLKSTVLELPEVCRTGEGIKAQQPQDIQDRVSFVELDATSPDWPVSDSNYDIVLMSYISGSVPESVILPLYKNAFKTRLVFSMPPMAAMAMPAPAAALPPVLVSPPEVKAASSAWTPQLERGHRSGHVGAKMVGAAAVPFLIGGVASASRRRLRQSAKSKHCKVVMAVGSTIETLEKEELTDEELQSLFDAASEGKDVVTFDQAASLEGVDAVLEEGAANVEELKVIWGDPDEPLDFEGFSAGPGQKLGKFCMMLASHPEGVRSEFCGGQTDKVPEYQKPPWKLAEEIITGKTDDYLEDYRILVAGCAGRSRSRKNLADSDTAGVEDEGASRSTEGMATPPRPHYPSFPSRVCCTWPETGRSAGGGRQNVEITQLFRQACDEKNLLSFDALKEISESRSAGFCRPAESHDSSQDISEEELEEIWDELPKKNAAHLVDELFEYVEEDEEEEEDPQAIMQVEGKGGISKAKKRGLQTVKQDLLDAIARLEAQTDKPAGLGSTEEKDGEVVKLAGELEDVSMCNTCMLPPEQRALALYNSLTGRAWIYAEELDMDILGSHQGISYYLEWVQTRFAEVELHKISQMMADLFKKCRRRADQPMRDFIVEFERLLLRLQEVQCELPGRVKAWLFLDKLKLSENEELALLSSVNNEWCVKRLQQAALLQESPAAGPGTLPRRAASGAALGNEHHGTILDFAAAGCEHDAALGDEHRDMIRDFAAAGGEQGTTPGDEHLGTIRDFALVAGELHGTGLPGWGPLLAILDTACSKTVAGHDWFESYCQLADRVGFLPEIVEEGLVRSVRPDVPDLGRHCSVPGILFQAGHRVPIDQFCGDKPPADSGRSDLLVWVPERAYMVHGVMSGEAVVKEQGFKSVFFPKKIAPEVQAMLEGDWVSSGEGFMAWWRLADQSREFWVETPSELTRVHVTPRKHLFVPSRWSTQHSALKQNLLETLGGTRTTDFLPCLCDGVVLQQRTDQWKLPCEELSCGLWVGRSRFSKEGTNLQARSLPPPGATFHGRALALGMEDGEERHLGRAPLLRGAVPRHLAAAGAEDHLAGAAASTSAPGRGFGEPSPAVREIQRVDVPRGPEGQEKAGAAASKEIDKLIDDPDMNSQVRVRGSAESSAEAEAQSAAQPTFAEVSKTGKEVGNGVAEQGVPPPYSYEPGVAHDFEDFGSAGALIFFTDTFEGETPEEDEGPDYPAEDLDRDEILRRAWARHRRRREAAAGPGRRAKLGLTRVLQAMMCYCAVASAHAAEVEAEVDPSRILNARFAYKDKNHAKRKQDSSIPARPKARLGVAGHRDPDLGVVDMATEAPTANRHSFLNGVPAPRRLFFRQPVRGIPSLEKGQLVEIVKGVFGLSTSPKLWWLKLSGDLKGLTVAGTDEEIYVVQNPIDPCVFMPVGRESNRVRGLLLTHVDDLLLMTEDQLREPLQTKLKEMFPVND
eukprot:s1097_g17.t1